jgi:hypothetical protein
MTLFRRILGTLLVALALTLPAQATVNTAANKTIAAGNGSQTVFTFGFVGVAAQYISVTYTDASGNQTLLTQGSGATQYQITLNAPVTGAIWGVGGTITYNPSGTPIPSGSTLTILRTLPLTQGVSLSNQSSVQTLGKGAETGLDTDVMQGQQIAEQIGRALQMNAANSVAPAPLPPAAQAANMGLCFDGTGNNVIACSLAPAGVISSAMAPVVGAASIGAAQTAMGLGSLGTLAPATTSPCLAASGGLLGFLPPVTADSSNQTVTAAFNCTVRAATGALVYTLPLSSTVGNGFSFSVYAQTATVAFLPNVADNFAGISSGQALFIPAGTQARVATSGTGLWYADGTAGAGSAASFNAPLNVNLVVGAVSNAVAISVVDRNFYAPSPSSPVLFAARDPTVTAGDPVPRAVTGTLQMSIPAGATLGTVSGQANRIWIGLFDNNGTPVLGVYNSLSVSGSSYVVLSWDETTPVNGTAITSGSTSAQTWYTASAVTSKAFRILGYFESTQSTAGTWAASPNKVQLFGPGVKRPGDIIQKVSNQNSGTFSTTSATFVVATNKTVTFIPQSAANLMEIRAQGNANASAGVLAQATISRGTVSNSGILNPAFGWNLPSAPNGVGATLTAFDIPNTSAPITYATQVASNGATTVNYGTTGQPVTMMDVMEIQI